MSKCVWKYIFQTCVILLFTSSIGRVTDVFQFRLQDQEEECLKLHRRTEILLYLLNYCRAFLKKMSKTAPPRKSRAFQCIGEKNGLLRGVKIFDPSLFLLLFFLQKSLEKHCFHNF